MRSSDSRVILGQEQVSRALDDRPRSYDRFCAEDLDFLCAAALRDLADFEARRPIHSGLRGRLLCIALCQGAAAHMADGEGGVHDFDVWSFFRRLDGVPDFPVRRRITAPFERPTFLASSRRIDLLGRSIADLGDAYILGELSRIRQDAHIAGIGGAACLDPLSRRIEGCGACDGPDLPHLSQPGGEPDALARWPSAERGASTRRLRRVEIDRRQRLI